MGAVRGVLAAQKVVKQARTLTRPTGLHWVEVDLAVLRGEREPELTRSSTAERAVSVVDTSAVGVHCHHMRVEVGV